MREQVEYKDHIITVNRVEFSAGYYASVDTPDGRRVHMTPTCRGQGSKARSVQLAKAFIDRGAVHAS
jgi:hypothetical protein